MFCSKCGEKNPDGAKFCAKCGAPIAVRVASPGAGAPAPARRRSRVALVVAAVAAVLVVCAAATGVWLAFFSSWTIDERAFPDPGLRAAVAATADTNHDGQLSRDEGRAVTSLSVEGATSLEGLGRYFPNLDALALHGGTLTSLRVNDLPNLVSLSAESEPLQALNVSENPRLKELHVSDATQVTGLESTTLHESWVVTSVEESYGMGYTVTYAVERDDQGRVTGRSVTDGEEESWWRYDYDDQGRLVSETECMAYNDAEEVVTTYGYDDAGNLTSVESYGGVIGYYYTYDAEGRLSTMSMGGVNDPTSLTSYAYDDAGRLTSRTYVYKNTRGVVDTFAYDGNGNLIATSQTDETLGKVTEGVVFERDAQGNVVRVAYDPIPSYFDDNWSAVEYGYDDQGRVVSATAELNGSTYVATVSYDGRGNVTQVEDGVLGGRTTTFTPTYTRLFVAEGDREPDAGITVGVEYVPLVGAQRTSLVNVWATPRAIPDPDPAAQPGESMVILV